MMEDRRYTQAAELLPPAWRQDALLIPEYQQKCAEEFRLRVGQAMTVLLPDGEFPVSTHAVVTQEDLVQLCDVVTGYSAYAFDESMKKGYLTAKGGFRVGLCGNAVIRNGENAALKDYSSAVVRICRQRIGLAVPLAEELITDGCFPNTLILAPPGCGKTTLLRDLVRLLSDGTTGIMPHRLAVVDERSEIAAMYQGKPQLSVGVHTDVLDACPKAIGIPMLLRNLNPQIIAVDEITVQEDLEAMTQAAHCGVALLATIHAADKKELQQKPLFRKLIETKVFEKAITIRRSGKKRMYQVETL